MRVHDPDPPSSHRKHKRVLSLCRDGWPYYCCAEFLYSDVSAGKNLFEKNILYGSASGALFHHCGLENESRSESSNPVLSYYHDVLIYESRMLIA